MIDNLIDGLKNKNIISISKLITSIENNSPQAVEINNAVFPLINKQLIIVPYHEYEIFLEDSDLIDSTVIVYIVLLEQT